MSNLRPEFPRPEFPRPDFLRNNWMSLNGAWDFSFDEKKSFSHHDVPFDQTIQVPFCYESTLSGIGQWQDTEVIWYRRNFTLTKIEADNASILLKFGAVDEIADVWINGSYIGQHTGGYTEFFFDIKPFIQPGHNTLIVRAADSLRTDKPRGKQSWKGKKFGCWYTPTSGIWQSVWLEFTGKAYLKQALITPDFDQLTAIVDLYTQQKTKCTAIITATLPTEDETLFLAETKVSVTDGYARTSLAFPDEFAGNLIWHPNHPQLIDINISLLINDQVEDQVVTYFGMRKISVQDDVVLLNNAPFFQRLILDQGYWRDSLLTPPSDEAIRKDIELVKAMGFNGVRKHQKIEDPRFYYWADKMGLLVWGELPSHYRYNSDAVCHVQQTLADFIRRDYNHPSIITWVTLNESWGVRAIQSSKQQQDFAAALYYQAKALDQTRLVSSNDGWEQIEANDICALHDYAIFADNTDKYDDVDAVIKRGLYGKMVYADSTAYKGKPLIMTEYGGIAFASESDEDWGYFGNVKNEAEFLARLEPVTNIFIKSRQYAGFCYTQLTDVQQEINGLLDIDRKPKIKVEKLRDIFGRPVH